MPPWWEVDDTVLEIDLQGGDLRAPSRVISGTTFSNGFCEGNDGAGSIHAEFSRVWSTRVKVPERKLFLIFRPISNVKMPAESTTFLRFNLDATLTSARICTSILGRPVVRLFQGTVERVPKEPTASAPTTMEILVVAPPG